MKNAIFKIVEANGVRNEYYFSTSTLLVIPIPLNHCGFQRFISLLNFITYFICYNL